ncbi:TPA: DUF3383 family protein [Escherichia coli]|nr:DUF3383 family protein [Escherichia coli]HCE0016079.1 DUF3383 family protein [Escherichia coli]
MQASVVYWLSANYRASGAAVAMDASPAVMMRNAMQKLAKRWTRRFDDMAQKLADRFANDAMKNADASLATAFKDAGFTVEFKMASQMNNALQATIAENVGLIRSIPEKYFTEVEGLVMRSVARGRDLSYLTDELQKRYGISTITFADEGTLATGLKLTEATGAVISQGAAPAVVDDIFTAILAKEQDWVTFSTTFAVTKDQANAFALWTNSQNHRFAYVPWDASGTAIVAGSSNALVYDIINTYAYNDTCPVYGYPNHAANAMGFVAALNFTQANGRCSLNGRQVSGLLPMISNDTDYEAAKANGYNFYGNYASNAVETNQWAPGSITGDYAWLDAWAGQVWVNAQLQAALVALFQQASNLPFAAAGKARIESCMKPTIEQFRAWGGMTAGTDLDQSQIDQINAIAGVDVTDSLMAEGYYVYIGPFTAAMRAARTKPTVYFWYTDGGIIQGITVNSTEVQ